VTQTVQHRTPRARYREVFAVREYRAIFAAHVLLLPLVPPRSPRPVGARSRVPGRGRARRPLWGRAGERGAVERRRRSPSRTGRSRTAGRCCGGRAGRRAGASGTTRPARHARRRAPHRRSTAAPAARGRAARPRSCRCCPSHTSRFGRPRRRAPGQMHRLPTPRDVHRTQNLESDVAGLTDQPLTGA
jgi:hypothetical protein